MKNILVVDDDRATRHLLRGWLKAAGFAATTAADGLLALAQLRKQPFDVMLLDIWMPRLNGLDVLARLRSEEFADSRPKVVVMTSDDTPETLLRAVREQAYQYLVKPFESSELVETIKEVLSAPPPVRPIQVLSARPHWVELVVPCERATAERIQSFMLRLKADLPEEVRDSVGRVFRELLLNAIEWGGQLNPDREVRISYLRARRMLLYRISDPGQGFRFDELPHAAVSNPPGDPCGHTRVREQKGMRSGGFGILMARALVDELLYNETQNEVVFVKYLD